MQSPKERGLDDLASWLIKEEITVFISTPTLFRNFARALNATPLFPRLRLIKLGSEPVAKADVGLYKQLFSSECVLVNWISTTETGNFAHYFIDHRTEISGETVPIGFPPEDVEIFLLDDTGQEVERGKVGEIAVKSRYFPPGYWRAADLTAAKFLLDPDAGDKRIYLTGDLGRMNSDGCLEHLGRKDDQVKIRGYRIEVAEIESALMNLENIEEAAVDARNDHGEEKHLVAYILPRFRNSPPSVTLIRRALRERLPDYMVPSAFVFMETMPRTNTGKVDRRALPEPKNLRPEIDDPFAPPTTPVEERLAKIWARVLGVNRVGIHDDFFELGGHSLSGIRLITAIQREFQLNLPLRRLFESSTVAGLAACIEAERTSGAFANQKQTKRWSYLFELKPGNNRKPVFFLPGGVGGDYEFLVYARLAHYVGPDYPFYGLRARSADGTKQAHASVKEMAADYIQEIRSFQSEGPYFLVGNCIGGVVAYEIARQLKAQGQKIACLAMMDTHRPSISIDLRYRARRGIDCLRSIIAGSLGNYRAVRIAFHWKQISEQSWKDKLSYLYGKTDSILIGIRQILFSSTASSGPGNAAAMRRMESIQRGYGRTLYRYRPRPYEGRVSLVVNEEAYRNDPTLGWADLVLGGIEVYQARGDHETYIRDHVQAVAGQLRECLEKAQREI